MKKEQVPNGKLKLLYISGIGIRERQVVFFVRCSVKDGNAAGFCMGFKINLGLSSELS